jgi:predicted amidohydrolase YtcJ
MPTIDTHNGGGTTITARGPCSIGIGKYADFTVFDNDLMTIPEAEILTSENMMTIVGGRITYQQ